MSDPTYNGYEQSIESGQPQDLYRFTLGAIVWCYTSADSDITAGGQTYKTTPISNDGIKQNGDAQSELMTITCPNTVGPAVVFSTSPPSDAIKVEILGLHVGMTTPIIRYVGFIQQIGSPTPGGAKISVQAVSATMSRTGLRLGWQRSCPYSLYDPLTCRANKAAFAISGFIHTITGSIVTVDEAIGKADGYFGNGFIEWTHPVRGLQRIMIESSFNSAGTLTIFDDVQELNLGMPVTLYPGCNKTPDVCSGTFDNILNYGGYEYMPGKSPYDGNPIY